MNEQGAFDFTTPRPPEAGAPETLERVYEKTREYFVSLLRERGPHTHVTEDDVRAHLQAQAPHLSHEEQHGLAERVVGYLSLLVDGDPWKELGGR